jgi:integrase
MAAKRRRKGTGSVYQDRHGQWWAKVELGDGKLRRSRCATRKAAEAEVKRLTGELNAGIDLVSSQQSVKSWLEYWIGAKAASVKPSTLAFYTRHCEYVLPHIGAIALERLTPTPIRAMLTSLGQSLAPRSVAHVLTVLRSALDMAVSDGIVATNAAKRVELPRVPEFIGRILDADEQAALIAACEHERQGLLIEMALRLGLRRGELIYLRWADIDWTTRTLQAAGQDGKSASAKRWLPLTDTMIARLQEHRARIAEEQATLGEAWRDHDLVFPSEVGTPLGERNVTRLFKRILRRANLPEIIRLHDLRGTAITDWIATGVDVKAAQVGAGHSNPVTTLRYYAQARAENLRKAVEEAERRREPPSSPARSSPAA